MSSEPLPCSEKFDESDEKNQQTERNVTINLLVLQPPSPNKRVFHQNAEIQFENSSETTFKIVYSPEISTQKGRVYSKPKIKSTNKSRKIERKTSNAIEKPKKKINIGWLHCPKDGKKFTQVRATNGGGLRYLELGKDHKPKIDEFLEMAKQLFFENKNVTPYGPMNQMNFYIGNFDGKKITEFKNREGVTCDVWEFMQSRGLSPSRSNFYLLSESIQTEIGSSSFITSQLSIENQMDLDLPKEEIKSTEEEESDCAVYVVFSYTLDVRFMISTEDSDSQLKINTILNSTTQCMSDALSRGLIPLETPPDKFNPINVGYEIIKIQLGESVFYQADYQNGQCRISYPSCEEISEHSILHQPDDVLGIHEGVLGAAVIMSCDNRCRPVFTWFSGKKEFAKGERLFFVCLYNPGLYHCEIKCDGMKKPVVTNQFMVRNIVNK